MENICTILGIPEDAYSYYKIRFLTRDKEGDEPLDILENDEKGMDDIVENWLGWKWKNDSLNRERVIGFVRDYKNGKNNWIYLGTYRVHKKDNFESKQKEPGYDLDLIDKSTKMIGSLVVKFDKEAQTNTYNLETIYDRIIKNNDNELDITNVKQSINDKIIKKNKDFDEIKDEHLVELKKETKEFGKLNLEEQDAFINSSFKTRNGKIQRIFRKNLLIEFDCKCAICNINDESLLVSSHILPYSKCENKEDMINRYNGLLLCPNHDALFDKNLISFNDNGKIIISSKIDKIIKELNIDKNISLDKKYLTKERKYFLRMHRELMK